MTSSDSLLAEPSKLEASLATKMRRLALREARDKPNPIARTDEVVAKGLAHFADHCASCHANNGSGQIEIGGHLYPRAPDMRRPATQALTDGELFAIIENGVRFTGMPAWGDGSAESQRASWHLVHFIRRLPELTQEEMLEMKALNPKGPDDRREEEEEERFLEGQEPAPAHENHHHHRGPQGAGRPISLVNARLLLGHFVDHDYQQDQHQYADQRPNPHSPAHPSDHPSVWYGSS